MEGRFEEMEADVKSMSEQRQAEDLASESNTRKMKVLEKELRDMCYAMEEKTTELSNANGRIKELEKSLEEAEANMFNDMPEKDGIPQEDYDDLVKELEYLKEEIIFFSNDGSSLLNSRTRAGPSASC